MPHWHNPLAFVVGGLFDAPEVLGRLTVLWYMGDGIEDHARIGPLKEWGKRERSLQFCNVGELVYRNTMKYGCRISKYNA